VFIDMHVDRRNMYGLGSMCSGCDPDGGVRQLRDGARHLFIDVSVDGGILHGFRTVLAWANALDGMRQLRHANGHVLVDVSVECGNVHGIRMHAGFDPSGVVWSVPVGNGHVQQ
jgi:hypothetical protein